MRELGGPFVEGRREAGKRIGKKCVYMHQETVKLSRHLHNEPLYPNALRTSRVFFGRVVVDKPFRMFGPRELHKLRI